MKYINPYGNVFVIQSAEASGLAQPTLAFSISENYLTGCSLFIPYDDVVRISEILQKWIRQNPKPCEKFGLFEKEDIT